LPPEPDQVPQKPHPHQPGLRRELGLRDLTLFLIALMVGPRWISVAAHGGPGTIILWFLAALLFAVPLAIAVAALSAKYPGAGGLYLWARNDFGPWPGFLNFWIYWLGIAFLIPGGALFALGIAVYSLGPSYAWLADNPYYMIGGSVLLLWVALGTNLIGVNIGKWTENIGGATVWILGALLCTIAVILGMRHGPATPISLKSLWPVWNWDTMNSWAAIAFALTGIEAAGMMAAEIHDPRRTIPRAAAISSAFVSVFYIASTLSLLAIMAPAKISEMNGLAQVTAAAGAELAMPWLASAVVLLIGLNVVGSFGGIGSAVSRMPFAAGVDHLLPAAFGKVHPRWHTPHVAILSLGAVATLLLIACQAGDTVRAAYRVIVDLTVIVGFLPYLYIFASAWKAGKRFSAISGTALSLLAIACSIAPPPEVTKVWLFEGKLALGTFASIASGWLLYRRYLRISQNPTAPS
jgi:glutamate:GABA antiporter